MQQICRENAQDLQLLRLKVYPSELWKIKI